jgi:hypothetical protein
VGTPRETAIRSEIAKLKEVYPWVPGRSQAFWVALSDLWPEDVAAGVLQTLRDWTKPESPAPGYVRERALAARAGKLKPSEGQKRGPVPWHEARTPFRDGSDGHLRDADGRFVMLPPQGFPPLRRVEERLHGPGKPVESAVSKPFEGR